MRTSTIILLAGLCLAVALAKPTKKTGKIADPIFLQKQRDILRLFLHVNQPNTFPDQVQIAQTYSPEENVTLYTNPTAVKEFYKYYKAGLLPRGEPFSILYTPHRNQAVALFHLFFYAQDYDTFYKTIVWARDNVNEGMYVYALTVAVLHRKDLEGIVLPPPYEIYPHYFVDKAVIQKAFEYKMMNYSGIPVDIEKKVVIYSNLTNYISGEQQLSYFTDDIGMNSYYYYFHVDYPFWMGGDEYGLKKDHRGELYYYTHHQLVARYYLERISNDLGDIPLVDYRGTVETPYTPNLRYPNGVDFPNRPANAYYVRDDYTQWAAEEIESVEARIRDAIDMGYIYAPDGTKVNLVDEEGLDTLGNLIEGNPDSPNRRLYGYLHIFARTLLGFSGKPVSQYKITPSVLDHYETALRDPVFYQIYEKIIRYFLKYKEQSQGYTYDELNFAGVNIDSVTVDKLITYYDYFDVDITNALYTDITETADLEKIWVKARTQRINHKPYNYKISVTSDKVADVVVRIFLGPKYDSEGNVIDIEQNHVNFVELDKFRYNMTIGKNVIARSSRDSYHTVQDRTSFRVLYWQVQNALTTGKDFILDNSEAHCGFPNRMLLPKGTKAGVPYVLFVHVAPYTPVDTAVPTYDETISCGVGSGSRFFDKYPLGYPLDRAVDSAQFNTPNMYFQDVIVFHKDEEIKPPKN